MPDNYVSYNAQTPSENEKVQARQNIGAMGLNSFDLYMNGAVPRPPVPPFFTQRIPNIVPGYTEFELINGLNHALLIEQTARQNTDLLLKENLEKETADRIQADNQLQENITAEATARENADNQLQENINAEATAREEADTTLQNNINAEKTARENADTTLQNNINAEKTARENADSQLQQNITAEATAREEADTQLEGKISGLQADLATEKTNRENADTSLQQAITAETTARQEDNETVTANIEQINTTIQSALSYLNTNFVSAGFSQNYNEEQKAQARANIGVTTGGSTDGAVLYNQAQNLTDNQKLQARENTGSVGAVVYENNNPTNTPARLFGGTFTPAEITASVGGFKLTYSNNNSTSLKLQKYSNNSWNDVINIPNLIKRNIILTDNLKINITGEPTFTYPLSYSDYIPGLLGSNAGYAVKRFFSGTLSITEAANVVTNCNVLEMYFLPFVTNAEAGSSGSLKYKIVLEVTGVSSGSTHQVGNIITLYNKLWDNSYESVNGTVNA